jgi:hypothetical protein
MKEQALRVRIVDTTSGAPSAPTKVGLAVEPVWMISSGSSPAVPDGRERE